MNDTKEQCSNTHEGKVVSATANELVSTCSKGHEHSHTVAPDAKVTCGGKVCKTTDLKAGTDVRVTTKKDDQNVAIGIEATDKAAPTKPATRV